MTNLPDSPSQGESALEFILTVGFPAAAGLSGGYLGNYLYHRYHRFSQARYELGIGVTALGFAAAAEVLSYTLAKQ